MKIDKTKLKDSKGRYLVQGLFLEDRYDMDMAIFTYDSENKLYKGKTFISLKKLYLDFGDPTEYKFATTYLYDWDQWQRMCNNKAVSHHIEKWRNELNLLLAAEGIETLIDLGTEGKSYQAAKWLADNGWVKNERGRPSKEEIEGELKRRADETADWNDGVSLLHEHRKKK